MSLRDPNAIGFRTGLRPSRGGYTLTEMVVVAGIIIFVAAISVPMMAPFFRGSSVREASEIFKMACVSARSRAIQQNVTQDLLVIATGQEQSVQVLSAPRLPSPANVATATATSVVASGVSWTDNDWNDCLVTILSGVGAGQTRGIASSASDSLTLKASWQTIPETGATLQIYKSVEPKIGFPANTQFDFTGSGVSRRYSFAPMGTISATSTSHMTFSIEDTKEVQARADIAGGKSPSEVERGAWRDFRIYSSTGMVYSEQGLRE